MTMTDGSADENALDDVFGSGREDRGGKEPAPAPTESDTGLARDGRGRFAAKSTDEPVEGQPPPADVQDQQLAPDQQSPPDPNANRHVPLSELLSERKKFKSREDELTRLHLEADARAKAYEQMIQTQQQRHVPPPQPQQQIEPPDPITDPEGYVQHHLNRLAEQQRNEMLFIYEERAREKHGNQVVEEALQQAQATGILPALVGQRDPWSALMKWHKDEKIRATIGDDIEGYNKRLEDQIRQKVLEELKAGGAQGQQQPRFPGTLANATATGTQGAVLTDGAMMGEIFGSDRRNRRG